MEGGLVGVFSVSGSGIYSLFEIIGRCYRAGTEGLIRPPRAAQRSEGVMAINQTPCLWAARAGDPMEQPLDTSDIGTHQFGSALTSTVAATLHEAGELLTTHLLSQATSSSFRTRFRASRHTVEAPASRLKLNDKGQVFSSSTHPMLPRSFLTGNSTVTIWTRYSAEA